MKFSVLNENLTFFGVIRFRAALVNKRAYVGSEALKENSRRPKFRFNSVSFNLPR